ncbi:MAG: hypothetical protein JWM34_3136 [Ilumatobacteraceae bacterium]|nr:hypothetical protein [Ilumatobacteraceae bacterium]
MSDFSKKSRKSSRAGSIAASCLLSAVAVACGSSTRTTIPIPLQQIIEHPDAPATDTIEVFVCAVPADTTDPIYGRLPLRLHLDPVQIATELDAGVRPYFETLSNGHYSPHFTGGTTLTMTASETHDQCVDAALDASAPTTTTVFVVADAEHLETEPGGWGRPGSACATTSCPAAATRRAAYVGASDFYPDGNTAPLLDLIEHEIGHTLDLPHSGDGGGQYDSALDVMSNSAAPRDVQPGRRSAQGTIAIDRLELGWLPPSAVVVAAANGGTQRLSPSAGASGTRLLVLPVDDHSFLTVEYLTDDGLDDFLPMSGIAVHRIDESPSGCTAAYIPITASTAATATSIDLPCTGIDREQTAEGSAAPHTDLLRDPGASWTVDGWVITARDVPAANGGTAQVEVHPTDG